MRAGAAIDRYGLDVFERSHLRLRHLHLYLVAHSGFGIAPIVGCDEAARSGSGNNCRSNIIRSRAQLTGKDSVNVDVDRWIAKRFLELNVAQFARLCEFVL